MSKYIVKNCPAYGITTPISCALTSDDPCEFTDCRIKQVVNKCLPNRYEGGTDTDILEILQVQEVE